MKAVSSSKSQLEAAMRRLFGRQKICAVPNGSPSKGTEKIIRSPEPTATQQLKADEPQGDSKRNEPESGAGRKLAIRARQLQVNSNGNRAAAKS